MRKFYLTDETGARYGLNGEQNMWFTEPQGLGVSFAPTFADIGDGFYSVAYDGIRQGSVTGNITFLQNVYPSYKAFTSWLMQAEKIYLIYQPTDAEYRAQVTVNFLTKSEINRGRWLQVPVSFSLLTPWYLPSAVEFAATEAPANVMVYPWRYNDAVYGTLGGSMAVVVPPAGHIPASFELSYEGELSNPVIQITGEGTGTVYGYISIGTTIAPGDKLVVSTKYLDSFIRAEAAGNLLPYVDLSHDPYPHLPLSEAVRVSLTASNDLDGTLKMSVFNYYRTV